MISGGNSILSKYWPEEKNCFRVARMQAPDNSVGDRVGEIVIIENYFSYFPTKIYVLGTQKNRLNETVLLSTLNTCLI